MGGVSPKSQISTKKVSARSVGGGWGALKGAIMASRAALAALNTFDTFRPRQHFQPFWGGGRGECWRMHQQENILKHQKHKLLWIIKMVANQFGPHSTRSQKSVSSLLSSPIMNPFNSSPNMSLNWCKWDFIPKPILIERDQMMMRMFEIESISQLISSHPNNPIPSIHNWIGSNDDENVWKWTVSNSWESSVAASWTLCVMQTMSMMTIVLVAMMRMKSL